MARVRLEILCISIGCCVLTLFRKSAQPTFTRSTKENTHHPRRHVIIHAAPSFTAFLINVDITPRNYPEGTHKTNSCSTDQPSHIPQSHPSSPVQLTPSLKFCISSPPLSSLLLRLALVAPFLHPFLLFQPSLFPPTIPTPRHTTTSTALTLSPIFLVSQPSAAVSSPEQLVMFLRLGSVPALTSVCTIILSSPS